MPAGFCIADYAFRMKREFAVFAALLALIASAVLVGLMFRYDYSPDKLKRVDRLSGRVEYECSMRGAGYAALQECMRPQQSGEDRLIACLRGKEADLKSLLQIQQKYAEIRKAGREVMPWEMLREPPLRPDC